MKKIIGKLYHNDIIRYIFFGGCTTLVNLIAFYLFQKQGMTENIANICSIMIAIIFAYIVNAKFVFEYKQETIKGKLETFGKFIGARVLGMGIEVGGFWLLFSVLGLPALAGKVMVQFIVIAFNYILSKFFVFK